jgi:hypothetical protein
MAEANQRLPVVAICAMVRDEAEYVAEWVEFHRRQGVSQFRIYDNGSVDGTAEEFLRAGIDCIAWPADSDRMDAQQIPAYQDGCRALAESVDWVACIDLDEFIFGRDGLSLAAALARYAEQVGAIAVQQLVFGSGGHRTREPGRVTDRFTRCAPRSHPECRWFKSIVRPARVSWFSSAHSVALTHGTTVLVDGIDVALTLTHPGEASRRAEGIIGLHHYILKSREEFDRKSAKWADRAQGQFKRAPYFDQRETYANAETCLELATDPILPAASATTPVPSVTLRVGRLCAADLPRLPDFEALIDALGGDRHDDAAFVHAPALRAEFAPEIVGETVFGDVSLAGKANPFPAREVVSLVLNNALYSGNSLAIVDAQNRLFAAGIENIGPPEGLASYDPVYRLDGDILTLDPASAHTETRVDDVIVPSCAAGAPNYGHFLFDGISVAFMLSHLLPSGRVRVAGQPLLGWQAQILDALGLRETYIELRGPVRARKIIATTTLAMHVSYPTGFIRPVFDMMRFRFGLPGGAPRNRRILLSRRGFAQRVFANRDEIETLARGLGLDIVRPETLSVGEQVRLFASASLVVGEAGAALANIGFCNPGAAVLEIQSPAFGDSWIRATCHLMGLRWHLLRAGNIAAPQGAQLAFAVDPAAFGEAVSTILARLDPA